MVTEGDLTLDGEHKIQCMDNVLYNCTLETFMIINQCHPNKFNKNFLKTA